MARWACRRPHPFTKANAAIFNIPTIPYTLNTILSSTSLPPSSPQAREARASFVFNALRETAKGRVIGIIIARPSDRAFPSTTTATDHVSVPVPEDKEGTEGEEWEMAYDVLPEFWGMGLGIKMVSGALGYIKWAGVEQVCALYQPENTASAALLAKAGFVKHGERHVEWPEEKGGGSRLCFKSKLEL
ncbi:hypothetical protein B9479_004190 [Cryptococcus floricola]|uniref:N-acetyltransferase domain-containing protein n=1 Tax=Cryptococcus floricola TaxID=2591691 RepID=A0A5D3AWB1_9TREE|nr:hypothetical protein B9479_004190 [Cryptococcus floricola]